MMAGTRGGSISSLAGGDDVLTGLDGGGRSRLGGPLPVANHAGRDIEPAAEFGAGRMFPPLVFIGCGGWICDSNTGSG